MNIQETYHSLVAELAAHPDFFKTVLDMLPTPIFYKDLQGRYLGCNRAYEMFYGIVSSDLVGKTVYEIAPRELAEIYATKDQQLFDSPGIQEYESQVKDMKGVVHDVIFNKATICDSAGNITGMVGMILDISERKQDEQLLNQSEAKYRMLVEHQAEGIVIADLDEEIIYSNLAGEEIFGVAPGTLTGRKVTDFVPAAAAARLKAQTNRRRHGEKSKYELDIIRPSGTARTLMVTGVPQISGDGAVVGTLAILQDITEQRRKEEEQETIRSWQAGVNRILESILAPAPLDQKMKIVTDGVVDTFGVDFCRIWLIDKGDRCNTDCMHAEVAAEPHVCQYRDKCLHLKASSGRYTHIDGNGHRRVPFGAYKIGRIAAGEEEKFLTNDAAHDPRVHNHEWAKSLGLVAFAGYRLKPRDGDVLGVFALFAKFPISPDMDAMLEGLSRAISLAIQKDLVEKALRESDDRYRQLVDNTDTGFVVVDDRGIVIEANEPYLRLIGEENREAVIGRSVIEWTAPEERDRNAAAVARSSQQGFIKEFETVYLCRNGARVHISISATTQETPGGKRIVSLCRNITERKLAEAELRKLSTAVEQSANVIVITDLEANIVYINQAFVDITGYSREEAMGKNPRILKSGEMDKTAYEKMWQLLLSGGKWQGELHNKKKNGDLYWEQATITSIKDEQGKPIYYMAIKEDVTAQKAVEQALHRSDHRFRQVTSSTNEWVWEIDPNGLYTYTNEAVSKILGYNSDELVGKKHYYDFFPSEILDEIRQAALTGLAQRRPMRSFVIPNKHKDGHVVTLEMNCLPFFSSDRVFLGYRGTNKDITMRRALEEEREQLISELQDSLDNIKTLKGLVPICASCKKIRDDKGYWQQVEEYVSKNTEAEFSHGLCDECAHKLYPEYFPDKKNQQI